MLGAIRLLLPPLDEQRAIAAFLDRKTAEIDALIAHKERLIALLHEKRAALITAAVTKGLDPSAPMKDSGVEWLGEIPAHWTTAKLKRLANVDYGLGGELDSTIMEGTPIISLPNVSIDGNLDLSEVNNASLGESDKQRYLLQKGDLLFNWRNGSSQHVGKTALFDVDGEYTHVSFLLRIRLQDERYVPRFFQRYLNTLRFTGFFLATKAGVNNTFNQSELKELEIPVPPPREQKKIEQWLNLQTSLIDSLITVIREGNRLLREYRTALISAAVTGKIDIRPLPNPPLLGEGTAPSPDWGGPGWG
jgi:type I restriction enzyme S subunit